MTANPHVIEKKDGGKYEVIQNNSAILELIVHTGYKIVNNPVE